jgi:hypothetical protein
MADLRVPGGPAPDTPGRGRAPAQKSRPQGAGSLHAIEGRQPPPWTTVGTTSQPPT